MAPNQASAKPGALPLDRGAEGERRLRSKRIGQHDLLEQAERERGQAQHDGLHARTVGLGPLELIEHLAMVDDRPGNELRKEDDE